MPICIYCQQTADSLEHPLPAAFGEFESAPQLVDRICRKCNNERLGVLDEQLTRCGPEAFIRRFYGVQGRGSHDPVNSFYRGSAKGQRLEMKVFDSKFGFEVLLECDNGVFRQLCQLVFIEQSGGKTHHLPIRAGISPEQLRAAFNNLGVSPPYEMHVLYGEEELVWIEPLLKATVAGDQLRPRYASVHQLSRWHCGKVLAHEPVLPRGREDRVSLFPHAVPGVQRP